jgi:ribosomal protein S18 acetylase RimI-like enzyme
VSPEHRGAGIGRHLLDACLSRAIRDGASALALHTTPIMKDAQHLYSKAGFAHHLDLPPMFGVPYVVLVKLLADPQRG